MNVGFFMAFHNYDIVMPEEILRNDHLCHHLKNNLHFKFSGAIKYSDY